MSEPVEPRPFQGGEEPGTPGRVPDLEFVVLTGFLGSGKTTLLRDFLSSPEAADTAVIVNEVGEVGLDGAILREGGAETAMTMLANGCICCRLAGSLAPTIEALLAAERPGSSRPLARIVLETSGLSKPGPVLRQLASLQGLRMRAAVLATYDALRGPESAGFEEAAAQWAGAHRIIVTKADAVSAERLAEAAREAQAINPLAGIVASPRRAETVRAAFAPPSTARTGLEPRLPREPGMTAPHPRLRTLLLRQKSTVAYDDLASWLDNLAGALGDRMLRLKGLVRIEGEERPVMVQSVGTLFSGLQPFTGEPPESWPFLVLIARDLGLDELDSLVPALPFVARSLDDRYGFRSPRTQGLRAEPAFARS